MSKPKNPSLEWYHRNKEHVREKYHRNISIGKCPVCKGKPLVAGKRACETCLERSRIRSLSTYQTVREIKDDRKKRLIAALGGKCVDCGYDKHFAGFEFDHLRDKKYNISDLLNTTCPLEKLDNEAAKCELVCATCHRIRTFSRLRARRNI